MESNRCASQVDLQFSLSMYFKTPNLQVPLLCICSKTEDMLLSDEVIASVIGIDFSKYLTH